MPNTWPIPPQPRGQSLCDRLKMKPVLIAQYLPLPPSGTELIDRFVRACGAVRTYEVRAHISSSTMYLATAHIWFKHPYLRIRIAPTMNTSYNYFDTVAANRPLQPEFA